jgi:DNA-binding transcriptional MerR regulator
VAAMKTVGEVSELSGVTVRALHHYDKIGLLSPSERTDAGYRLYSRADLERLQEILGWRALGFELGEIRELLGEPSHDRIGALRAQLELVTAERARLAAIAAMLDDALNAHDTGTVIKEAAMFKGMHDAHQQEAQERWGQTDAYKESQRRTARYGKDEWREIHAQARANEARIAELMRAGEPADGKAARAAAEELRLHIDRWFYPCSHEMHRNLAEMYVGDSRFRDHYDAREPGLAQYVRDAIVANANTAV